MCGAAMLDQVTKQTLSDTGALFDDAGDNISAHNPYLGDLTGLYWIWKNTSDEFVGTNQYRRFWVEEEIDKRTLNDKTLYISSPFIFGHSIADQYVSAHGPHGLMILESAIRRGRIDMTQDTAMMLKQINQISPCNMFFGHRTVFNKVCEKIFPMVFELYEGSKYCLDFIQPDNQTRLIAFLCERLLTLMYTKKEYYFGSIEIESVAWRST